MFRLVSPSVPSKSNMISFILINLRGCVKGYNFDFIDVFVRFIQGSGYFVTVTECPDSVLLYDCLLDVLHLRGIAGFGCGLLVGVADGEDVIQLVIGGNVKTVEEELTLLVRYQHSYGSTETTGAQS